MANTRLFDSWQIQKELPAPFDRALANRPRYSTKEEDCSIHNRITRGKKATLFPVVLRALLNLIREGDGEHLAAGMQVQKGQTAFYCMEYHCKAANGEYDCAVVYNPKNGRIKERILCGSDGLENPSEDMHTAHTSPPFQITDSECTGEELIALLSYASIEKGDRSMMGNFLSITRSLKTIMTADGRIRRGCCIPHISAVIIYFVGLRMVLLYGKRGFPLTGTGMRMGMWMFCRPRNSVQGYIFPII